MDGKEWILPTLILGGIVLFVLMSRKPVSRVTSGQLVANQYDNEEIREIEYNADGLPIRIRITRHARTA